MSYIVVPYLDMCSGDVNNRPVGGFEQGFEVAKEYIAKDSKKCATIVHSGGGNYHVYMKIATNTNPTHPGANHHICWTVFYGKTV
jgi:hypothetical protein